ncbi:hypothetical protein [Macrococcoides canis]|uniref:hypothetical protein n=1 Tax=Macrococcoides canis TaxID=1855823 RepID=UPI00165E8974|nr:hypothetical protein [Macrococcus canis]
MKLTRGLIVMSDEHLLNELTSVIELSDIHNISKQAVFKHINNLNIETIKIKNKSYVSKKDLSILKAKLSETNAVNQVDKLTTIVDEGSQKRVDNINEVMLKDELNKQQINYLNSEVERLQLELENALSKLESSTSEVSEFKSQALSKTKEVEVLREAMSDLSTTKNEYYEQLKEKDKQINKLNSTLDEQQKLLFNQQSLALQSNEKIKQLEAKLEIANNTEDTKPNASSPISNNNSNKVDDFYSDLRNERQQESKGFFSKLFGKK